MTMKLKDLPKELEDIIMDYKYGLEHYERFEETLMVINFVGSCKKCWICERQDWSRLVFHIINRITRMPDFLYVKWFKYCYYRPHSI